MKPIRHSLILLTFFLFGSGFSSGQEICNNNIDDDGDRLIDQYDLEDCPCTRADNFKISLITNASFENTNCIPTGNGQLNCAEGWEQATLSTPELFSTNGFMPDMVPQPIPDGNNCASSTFGPSIMDYLGTCLNGPLLSGQTYLLKFNIAADTYDGQDSYPGALVDIVLFGSNKCNMFPLQTVFCPEGLGYTEIGRYTYPIQNQWSTIELYFTPQEDISSIMLGGSCDFPQIVSFDIFWDNLQLNRVLDEIIYYVPNTFTPNGDEHNNVFNPVFVCGYDPLEYRFDVYDRWGEIVFTSLDSKTGWDGSYHGLPAKEGVFGWKLEYKAENTTEKKVITGHANLLR
ncbi:T9SS type B sorting domain-containing protein [uncultured Fluviicola sp.]|uniref:T9SS type B sorting domain-containing protein n=1 Tax=uncultured Fluviicola sp. TaxID=463303 RepID=UPI0025D97724|nr:T9SS type B sorting domain-containing protein [uncultured Fluviicola sp.]